jgi:hypothetical protein
MNQTFDALADIGVPVVRVCALLGRSRATHYRHRLGPVQGPRPKRTVPDNGQALTAAEREAVLTLINREEYADLSIAQIWVRELDEGNCLCSMSSMYRIARDAGQTRERRTPGPGANPSRSSSPWKTSECRSRKRDLAVRAARGGCLARRPSLWTLALAGPARRSPCTPRPCTPNWGRASRAPGHGGRPGYGGSRRVTR